MDPRMKAGLIVSITAFLLGFSAGFPLHAQEPAPKPTAGQRFLRLLPLGDPPPFRQEIRDGIRYEIEPEPGTIPPRQVMLGEGEAAVTLRLNLGRATDRIKVPGGLAPLGLRVPGSTPDAVPVPWLAVRPPETGDFLALIWRDPGKPWSQPRAIVFPDGPAEFPAGNIRIINLLPTGTSLMLGTERILLDAGKSLTKQITIGEDLPLQTAYRDAAGNYQRFYAGSVLLNPNERAQIVIYRADGENPRRPAKVVVFNELAPNETKKEPDP